MNRRSKSTEGVVIYTSQHCGYCVAAKNLLQSKGVEFTEIDVLLNSQHRQEMIEHSGQRTVPQIFIGQHHIGGFENLSKLDKDGDLDNLLASVHRAPNK